ncbi:MAG: winged helix-turn-helix transcriptional regulator [Anaerolineae bacterium]|nr:winged helix-turn-helix transcriptional regulator [Anaerolineae bacterium]
MMTYFPITFRQDVIKRVFQFLTAGDSCLIVGIGSVGKSNLLRSIQNEEILPVYLQDEKDDFLIIYVDINKVLEYSSWGLFELMLHQMFMALSSKIDDDKVLNAVDDLHQRAIHPETRYLAFRFADRAVNLIYQKLKLKLVFIFDEFDSICQKLLPRDFSALRALRDDHKYRLMYVVATRTELDHLREDPGEIESFEELLSPNIIWLGPYSEIDANFMLQRLSTRYNINLDERVSHELLVATGGHPGLLRVAYRIAIDHPPHLLDALLLNSQILVECERIWHSLDSEEREALVYLAMNRGLIERYDVILTRLHHKGLIGGPWTSQNAIFSPLFVEFVRLQRIVTGEDIQIDRERRLVWVEDRMIEGLSPLEFRLIEYLETRRGQVCSRDELAEYLYPADMAYEGEGVSDARLGSIVTRVRKRIEPDPENPKYIVTVRGHGYKLLEEQADAG